MKIVFKLLILSTCVFCLYFLWTVFLPAILVQNPEEENDLMLFQMLPFVSSSLLLFFFTVRILLEKTINESLSIDFTLWASLIGTFLLSAGFALTELKNNRYF